MQGRHTQPRARRGRPGVRTRTCLICGTRFLSSGPGNRICARHDEEALRDLSSPHVYADPLATSVYDL